MFLSIGYSPDGEQSSLLGIVGRPPVGNRGVRLFVSSSFPIGGGEHPPVQKGTRPVAKSQLQRLTLRQKALHVLVETLGKVAELFGYRLEKKRVPADPNLGRPPSKEFVGKLFYLASDGEIGDPRDLPLSTPRRVEESRRNLEGEYSCRYHARSLKTEGREHDVARVRRLNTGGIEKGCD